MKKLSDIPKQELDLHLYNIIRKLIRAKVIRMENPET